MTRLLKLEALGLLLLFGASYHYITAGSWSFFLALFFMPDLSFFLYLVSKQAGTVAYNIMHHMGLMAVAVIAGWLLQHQGLSQVALIFLAHAAFDRVLGYGLIFSDSFDHTHLGWIGKSRHRNSKNPEGYENKKPS